MSSSPDRWTSAVMDVPQQGEPVYLLAERSRWVDEGIPGGARHDGEPVQAAAQREAAGGDLAAATVPVTGADVQDCGGGWRFHIVRADVGKPFAAYAARRPRRPMVQP